MTPTPIGLLAPYQITRKPDPWPCLKTGKPMYIFTLAGGKNGCIILEQVSSTSPIAPKALRLRQARLNTSAMLD